ncbi:MAG: hypothetical protein CFE44_12065 [Burkholderiales bacterium PBB4]|nr:MAG: hypothetical protein CFE44_12065 [Burkholderiales bacterium PBB4]
MLSLPQARALHLAAQGLLTAPSKAATPLALRKCIAQMLLLQIDTIHVVSRSPYLVLFSRLGPYPRHWLEDALAQGHIFETWAHEACFAPSADLLAHRGYNQAARRHWGLASGQRTHQQQRQHLDKLLAHIETTGPVKSSDFERKDGGGGAWWGWKDEKRWLEALFATGELMVARRENFHRVYDLSHRVAPEALAAEKAAQQAGTQPDAEALHHQFILQSVAALGVTQARWVNDYFRLKPRLKDADLDALVDEGALLRVAVEGWDAPVYVHPQNKALLKKAAAGTLEATHTTLLSPFDPVVWDRERGSSLFDFDYRLECYTPEPKRVYGYFVLPILCRGELIGRLDAKAHRAEGVFEVKALHAQPGHAWRAEQVQEVAQAIAQCARWHETPQVQITSTQPAKLTAPLRRALRQCNEICPL